MTPLPWMVLLKFVSVRPPVFCRMYALPPLLGLVDSVTVPPPLSVVAAFSAKKPLAPFPPLIWMVPLLVSVPDTAVVALLLAV